ncbi:hypothetical protein ANRL1_04353 [Anaerolineae bacterium]|nr:hypothetical protein ANRL1_04353 [Anaerolineae bacterium]
MVMRVSDTDTFRTIGEFLPKIQFAGERIIIEHQGVPVAAVISIQDLEQLQARVQLIPRSERLAALARTHTLRAQVLARRGGVPLPDSARLIKELREERDRETSGLH